jgi:predicted transcriptional regulator
MMISLDDYITLVSFGISVISVTIVISLYYSWDKRFKTLNHDTQVSPTTSDATVEVSAIVSEFTQRLRRLEEGLVDQKVKMEILELRASRTPHEAVALSPVAYSRVNDDASSFDNPERPSSENLGLQAGMRIPSQRDRPEPDKKLGVTEMEALRLVSEGRGKISAKEIQQRIGRTREHTARMMNSLYHDGLVVRDVTARPFSYSITEKGRDLLNG